MVVSPWSIAELRWDLAEALVASNRDGRYATLSNLVRTSQGFPDPALTCLCRHGLPSLDPVLPLMPTIRRMIRSGGRAVVRIFFVVVDVYLCSEYANVAHMAGWLDAGRAALSYYGPKVVTPRANLTSKWDAFKHSIHVILRRFLTSQEAHGLSFTR